MLSNECFHTGPVIDSRSVVLAWGCLYDWPCNRANIITSNFVINVSENIDAIFSFFLLCTGRQLYRKIRPAQWLSGRASAL